MKEAGFESQAALARASGIPQPTINRILKGTGKKGPETNTLQRLAAACNVNFRWLHEGVGPRERSKAEEDPAEFPGAMRVVSREATHQATISIRKVELKLSAGITGYQTEPDRRDGGMWELPRRWIEKEGLTPERLLAIDVKGESMEPTLYAGDVVVINTADSKPVNGLVYAINYEGEAVIKRLVREGGQWYLVSDNPSPQFPKRMCHGSEWSVVGRVVRREGAL